MTDTLSKTGRPARPLAIGGLCLLLAACAAAERPESFEGRVQARWDALLARDYATAYAFLTPGTRSRQTPAEYDIEMQLKPIQYTSARYLDRECQQGACTVRLEVGYRITAPVRGVPAWSFFASWSASSRVGRWVACDSAKLVSNRRQSSYDPS